MNVFTVLVNCYLLVMILISYVLNTVTDWTVPILVQWNCFQDYQETKQFKLLLWKNILIEQKLPKWKRPLSELKMDGWITP